MGKTITACEKESQLWAQCCYQKFPLLNTRVLCKVSTVKPCLWKLSVLHSPTVLKYPEKIHLPTFDFSSGSGSSGFPSLSCKWNWKWNRKVCFHVPLTLSWGISGYKRRTFFSLIFKWIVISDLSFIQYQNKDLRCKNQETKYQL